MARSVTVVVLLLAALTAIFVKYTWFSSATPPVEKYLKDVDVPDVLQDFVNGFGPPTVIKVADGAYGATNYALSNCFMLEGPDGVIIIDTTESLDAAREIAESFKQITDKPVKAIIYTHHHVDHITGAQAFAEGLQTPPEVWAHPLKEKKEERDRMKAGSHVTLRVLTQFGALLGPYRLGETSMRLRFNKPGVKLVPPTHYLQGTAQNVTLAGLEVTLLDLPGETADHMGVWVPSQRLLHVGDDIYPAFPNLYGLRGTSPRDVIDWITSLEKILKLRPRCIMGGHLRPVCGEEEVAELVTDYRAAIKFVHDQTLRHLNRGLHPDEIGKQMRFPPELASNPSLREVYGTLHMSVRGILAQYIGWFSGRAEELYPLTPRERAQRLLRWMGRRQLLKEADQAMVDGEFQWALELASHLHLTDSKDPEAIRIRAESMRELAARQPSFAARNLFMTTIMRDAGTLPRLPNLREHFFAQPIRHILQAMTLRLKAEMVPGVDTTVCFRLTDTSEFYSLHVHRGVADLAEDDATRCDVTLVSDDQTWRHLVSGKLTALNASKAELVTITGGIAKFVTFMKYFEST